MICVNMLRAFPENITLQVNKWYYGAYTKVCPSDAVCKAVKWSSADFSIASVNESSGYIYAKSAGTTKIYATATDGSGCSDYITVTVSDKIPVESVTLNNTSLSVEEGQCATLSATVCPANASSKGLNWCSSNTNVATINSGVITAVAKGSATITATATDGSCKSASCSVTVTGDTLVSSIIIVPSSKNMTIGDSCFFTATICPVNSTKKSVCWSCSDTNIVTVNELTGLVIAQNVGTAVIYATSCDGSNVVGCCSITVNPIVPVSSLSIDSDISLSPSKTFIIKKQVYPANATNKSVTWMSSNTEIATIGRYNGMVVAKSPGIATITATTVDGGYVAACEVWVRGKTPVFLIHGRTSNSFTVWGANNSIFSNPLDPDKSDNNHFDSSITARSVGNSQMLYTSKVVQDICSYPSGLSIEANGNSTNNFTVPGVFNGIFEDGKYNEPHPEGGNLAFYLKEHGYKENINLFVFNYPNEDAVVYSAKKFEKYIENLISYIRNNGTDEMKTCFYVSKNDYRNNNFKINLVAHSMGGLISRYYIENLGNDNHVDKLISICTPHWGSGYADTSCITGSPWHALCDHDLRFDSAMYGGSFSTTLNCNAITTNCYDGSYSLTDELNYSLSRNTKYYAIAAIDYKATNKDLNDYTFEMPSDFNAYQEIVDYMTEKSVHQMTIWGNIVPMDLHNVGDNMVGFLSQIGWTENDSGNPRKRINMEKIFIDVDSNGGNGNNIPGLEVISMLHSKVPHRVRIMEQVNNYLSE